MIPTIQMRLKRSFRKIRSFLHKTLTTLESFALIVYPDSPTSIASNNTVSPFNNDHKDSGESKANVVVFSEASADASHGSRGAVKILDEGVVRKKQEARKNEKAKAAGCNAESADGARYVLAKKMKELDMMDAGDVDVADALRCYSRLTCPVYVEIVDKFFNDMYEEYYLPEPSVGLSCPSRKLNSSGRRTLSTSGRRTLSMSSRRQLDISSRRLLDTYSRRLSPLNL